MKGARLDMAHAMSHKAGGAVAVLRHDERTEKDKVQSRKNECIVPERTYLNYNLAPPRREKNLMQYIKQVCEENGVRINNRKDLNVMSSWVITAPKELPEGMEKLFFSVCYDFLSARYGEKFVLSAMVHKDETTPHMHFCFIPVAYDRKNDRLTVSSKLVLSRSELQRFHKELGARVNLMFGKDMGIENGATKNGNQTIEQLKEKSKLEKEIQELEYQKTGTENALQAALSDLHEINEELLVAKKKRATLEMSEKEIESIDLTPKKITGGFKGLSPDDARRLCSTALSAKNRADEAEEENNRLCNQVKERDDAIHRLVSSNAKKQNKINLLSERSEKLSFYQQALKPEAVQQLEIAFQNRQHRQKKKGLSR